MRDCTGPEHGVFCILILDLISIIALVLLSILSDSIYQYNKVPLQLEFIKYKRIHRGLLGIAVLQEILLQRAIKDLFKLPRATPTGVYFLPFSIDL